MVIKNKLKGFIKSKNFTLLIVIAIVVIVCQSINPSYLSGDNIKAIIYSTSLAGTLAVGIGCILISGNCDLSAGSVGCMGGIIIALLLQAGVPWGIALIITLVFGALCGCINAFFAFRCKMMPFISTLAMSSVWRGVAYIITDTYNIVIDNESFWKLGSLKVIGIPLPFIIMCVLMIIYGYILSSTIFGRKIYMVGGNRQAARLAGISTSRIGTMLMINCSTLACLGGAVLAARMHNGSPGSVNGTELEAITAAVLGGIAFGGGSGTMSGCFIGVMLLYTFNNGLTFIGLNSYWQIFFGGAILVLALALDYLSTQAQKKKMVQNI